MNLFLTFFNPINLIIIINIIVLLTYEIYSLEFIIVLTPLLILSVPYTLYLHKFMSLYSRHKVKKSIQLDNNSWQIFGYIVILIGIIELCYFGIPMLGHLKYVHFGFTVLHHIAVTTWLLVFIDFKLVWFNRIKFIYALLFPLLIFNRDIFLLTLCCLLFKNVIHNRIRIRDLIISSALYVTLFAQVGKLRSGNVQAILELPTKVDLESMNLITFWIFTYVTSPMFNIHYSFGSGERIRYEPLLTVFPEFYKLIEIFSVLGLYMYIAVGLILTLFPALLRFPGWLCFSFFFYYQFTMGCVFSNKLGNTHTIYIILIFSTMTLFRQLFKKTFT